MENEEKNGLVWLSVKVLPAFKERLQKKADTESAIGEGNLSEIVRKACVNYLAGETFENEDLKFLYNLLENKFKLKIGLTDIEKRKLQKIEGELRIG